VTGQSLGPQVTQKTYDIMHTIAGKYLPRICCPGCVAGPLAKVYCPTNWSKIGGCGTPKACRWSTSWTPLRHLPCPESQNVFTPGGGNTGDEAANIMPPCVPGVLSTQPPKSKTARAERGATSRAETTHAAHILLKDRCMYPTMVAYGPVRSRGRWC